MFAFAIAGTFGDAAPSLGGVSRLLDWTASTPDDGLTTAVAPHACAAIRRWAVVKRDRNVIPIWDPARQLLMAGDVRLYNRPELADTLRLAPGWREQTDLQLAWFAYLKWGPEAPRHLVGDYAFAVWDERRRSLFAVRDHFGVRPLHYMRIRGGVALASDVRHLLPLIPRPSQDIDPHKILDRYGGRPRRHGITYFQGVSQLRAGHSVSIDERGSREARYWFPPEMEDETSGYGERCERFRFLFRRAVEDRLESDHPVVAHSSGGFDSSSILVAADEIFSAEPARPALVMASAITAGMPCDDSGYMDALAGRVRFEGVRWNAMVPYLGGLEHPDPSSPGQWGGIAGGPPGDLTLARERGAKVLLTGSGGDTVTFAGGVLRDLLRAGQWGQLARETVLGRPLRDASRQLARAALGAFRPRLALRLKDALFDRRGPTPAWLGPRLRDIYPPVRDEMEIPDIRWPSHLACESWARITDPGFSVATDATVHRGSVHGIEVRAPFLDVRLVEEIMRVRWRDRIPRGDYRRFARDALGPALPPQFAARVDQGSWAPVWARAASHFFKPTASLMDDGTWLSAPYVDLLEARRMLRTVERSPEGNPRASVQVAEFGLLEAWLRQINRYDSPPGEVDICQTR